jgi:hypothetical protein
MKIKHSTKGDFTVVNDPSVPLRPLQGAVRNRLHELGLKNLKKRRTNVEVGIAEIFPFLALQKLVKLETNKTSSYGGGRGNGGNDVACHRLDVEATLLRDAENLDKTKQKIDNDSVS